MTLFQSIRGKDYATEMAQAFIEWAFHQSNVTCVTAECLVTNTPSVCVLERVGMKQTSQVENMIYWKIDKR
ncbi:GNAT family N-acetyltransferase [Sulfoacidibacillus ferrooxidans]|uniref:GNAT family N-acetyltransferase n=1 Tax=Sulfoacidibacillus ferrooxidans TaxID=2005001 RepID=UPI003AFAEA0A